MKTDALKIRWMIRRDMAAVMAIELESFQFPWTEEEFTNCLRQRNCIGMVAVDGDRIVGYFVYLLHRTHLELLNIAVSAKDRRRGIGKAMLDRLVSKLHPTKRARVETLVAERNLPGQQFFNRTAWRCTGIIRGPWMNHDDDALRFVFPAIVESMPRARETNRITGQLV